MTDSDFGFITPVEIVHNVQSLSPAQEREARKRRQNPPKRQPQPQEPESGRQPPNETPPEESTEQDGPHKIDYCA